MDYFNNTFSDSYANLAFEEVLLDFAEEVDHPGFLRFWESPTPFVVLGYAKKVEEDVFAEEASRCGIPILRRCSGGGTVLQGKGCFNYALVLPIAAHADLETISGSNVMIMGKQLRSVQKVAGPNRKIKVQGITDLTCNGLKFSGNAQRRKRTHLLFHGSFLLDYDLTLVERILKMPVQQPEYRLKRTHLEFINNLDVPRHELHDALCEAWNVTPQNQPPPYYQDLTTKTENLVRSKYSTDDWNLKF